MHTTVFLYPLNNMRRMPEGIRRTVDYCSLQKNTTTPEEVYRSNISPHLHSSTDQQRYTNATCVTYLKELAEGDDGYYGSMGSL